MNSLIDIMDESQKRYTMVEPKTIGSIAISGSGGDTELFNIKGSGVVKSLAILTGNSHTGVKIEIDGRIVYDSFTGPGDIYNSNTYLVFGDKNNLEVYYNSNVFNMYRFVCPVSERYYMTRTFDNDHIYPFDISVDNIALIPTSSGHLSSHTLFLSDGGIEFKKNLAVSAKLRETSSNGTVYAGIEYMMA